MYILARRGIGKSFRIAESGWTMIAAPDNCLHYNPSGPFFLSIKDWILGERRHVQIGVHGGTSEQETTVPLIVAQA